MGTSATTTEHHGYLQVLGELVRNVRQQANISQEGFAAIAGLGRAYVGHLERGKKNVTLGTLMAVLEGLQTAPEVFFRGVHLRVTSDTASREIAAGRESARRKPSKPVITEGASYSEMFGAAVRHERQRLGRSQEEFANEVGLTRTYVLTLEQGRQNPSFAVVMRILEGLQLEPAMFFRHIRLNPRQSREGAETLKGQRKSAMRARARSLVKLDGEGTTGSTGSAGRRRRASTGLR